MKQKSYYEKRDQAVAEGEAGDKAEKKASGQYVKEKLYVAQRQRLLKRTKAMVSH